MKKYLLPLLLFLALNGSAQQNDEEQIRSILAAQAQSWNCGDLKGFMKGYWQNDSLMFIGKNGITYGYEQTLANYRKNYPDMDDMGELQFTFVKLQPLGTDAYFVVGKWYLKREKKGDVGGHFTLLFRKINNTWVIVADHSS
jgi:ketosteroid isomerase-like protein